MNLSAKTSKCLLRPVSNEANFCSQAFVASLHQNIPVPIAHLPLDPPLPHTSVHVSRRRLHHHPHSAFEPLEWKSENMFNWFLRIFSGIWREKSILLLTKEAPRFELWVIWKARCWLLRKEVSRSPVSRVLNVNSSDWSDHPCRLLADTTTWYTELLQGKGRGNIALHPHTGPHLFSGSISYVITLEVTAGMSSVGLGDLNIRMTWG